MIKSNSNEKTFVNCAEFSNFLTDQIKDPVFVKDRNHRWIFLNSSFCNFLGHKKIDLLGKSDYDFFPKKEADVFWAKDEEVFLSGKENTNEENFTDKNGVTHVIVTKKVLYKDENNVDYLVGIIKDITVEKKAEEKSAKMFRVIPVGAVITRIKDGNVVQVNEEALKIFGYKEDEVLGNSTLTLKAWFDSKERDFCVKEILKNGIIKNQEVTFRKKDGSAFMVIFSGVLFDLNGEKHIISSFMDITEQKKTEEATRKRALELEKMNKMMIDRELKMVELKKKMADLKK